MPGGVRPPCRSPKKAQSGVEENPAPRPFAGKVEKRRGGLRGRRRALRAPAALPAPLLLLKRYEARRPFIKGPSAAKKRRSKPQRTGDMTTIVAFPSGFCSVSESLSIVAKERRSQRSLIRPRPSSQAENVCLCIMRFARASAPMARACSPPLRRTRYFANRHKRHVPCPCCICRNARI